MHHSVKTYMQSVKNDIEASSHESTYLNNIQNLTPGEKKALAELKERDDIIITKADKGGAIVIQDVATYITEAERQLGDKEFYERQPRDLTPDHTRQINEAIEQLAREDLLPEKAAKALKVTNPNTARFYMLPKIHKPNNPGHPIISAINNPTSTTTFSR